MEQGVTSKPASIISCELRTLTEQERAVIGWLLDHCDHGELFRHQIDQLTVCSKCTCGCPTVDFAFNGVPVSRKGERVISDQLAEMNNEIFGVMLFATDGKLSTLEVYSQTGNVASFSLPTTEEMFPWEELSTRHSPKLRSADGV